MKSPLVLLLLLCFVVTLTSVSGDKCPSTCSRRERYTTKCGLFGWQRCTRYRNVNYACSKSCTHGRWSSYKVKTAGACSVTCGGGRKSVTYQRTCDNPAPSNGGNNCAGSSVKTQQENCNTQKCPAIHGGWSAYKMKAEGACSVTCGGGRKKVTYQRTCTNPAPSNGGRNCAGGSEKIEEQTCSTQKCPAIHGGWSAYKMKAEGACSVTCGGGRKNVTYQRTCTNPAPSNGGKYCAGESEKTEEQNCNTQMCPIDGGWTEFVVQNIGECSMTCGNGSQQVTLNRTCSKPTPQFGGSNCLGSDTLIQLRACNPDPCPVDGGWSNFTDWQDSEECSVLCGEGTKGQHRSRTCNDPAPAFGGKDCEGEDQENKTVKCNQQPCGDKCPNDNVTFIAHPNNTNGYYQCDHGVARLQYCQANTHWIQADLTCVSNKSNNASDDDADNNNDNNNDDDINSITTEVGKLKQGDKCNPSSVYYPSFDCSKFAMCANGHAIIKTCPPGTLFNATINVCDFAANVHCDSV